MSFQDFPLSLLVHYHWLDAKQYFKADDGSVFWAQSISTQLFTLLAVHHQQQQQRVVLNDFPSFVNSSSTPL
jgi:hypothetical protein